MRQAGDLDDLKQVPLGALLFAAIVRGGAFAQGHPDDGRLTMIDGYLDLGPVAEDFLSSCMSAIVK